MEKHNYRVKYTRLRQLALIRHSEAEKTNRRVHGGLGTSLTPRGRLDTIDLACYLKENTIVGDDTVIFTGPRPQTKETAEILASELKIRLNILDSLRNINMGLFDGLTDFEATKCDPDSMARLKAWRNGQLSVEEIQIPGAEDQKIFVKRISSTLNDIVTLTTSPIVVVTRSVGIALHNLTSTTFDGNFVKYIRLRLDPGSVTLYRKNASGKMETIHQNVTSYLKGFREFSDD